MAAASKSVAVEIDARGMKCPWPALRLAKAMRGATGDIVLLADDPAAPKEVAALAKEQGWLLSIEHDESFVRFVAKTLK